jgi:acyl transferase domain-containing protein
MGRVALKEFPAFLDTIQSLDLVLSRLTPKPSFTIEELLSDPSVSQEKISDAEVTQPLCTAIQIALVDLFALWNITPLVSIGHSSGEIGAAYASGLVSAPEAIVAAFCRGRAVKEFSTAGSMLAVGLGASEVEEYLGSDTSKVCIACENSPSSVTLSGDAESISQLGADLTSKGIFARELKTGRAYHSPHMATVGVEYDEILRQSTLTLRAQDLDWRRPRTEMVSSVTGERITSNTLPSGYWSANLRQRVLFSTAVHRMATDDQFSQVVSMIEIGPHAALSGPFKQICMANKLDRFTYTPSLVRNKNDADQILSVAGSMYLSGYAVAFEEVNSDLQQGAINTRKPNTQYLLTDLPPYQWNYGKKYWAEPRGSAEQRGRVYDRHDLLGSRVSGLSDASKIWRNILRQRDVPWLKDHTVSDPRSLLTKTGPCANIDTSLVVLPSFLLLATCL